MGRCIVDATSPGQNSYKNVFSAPVSIGTHSHKAYHLQFKVIGVKSMLGKSLTDTQKVTPRI
jgi:hypothetical protein